MNQEFNLLCQLFELKEKKTGYIRNQKYDKAADARDMEREIEKKILVINGVNLDGAWSTVVDGKIYRKLDELFLDRWNIHYTGNYTFEYKQLLRQIKLQQIL